MKIFLISQDERDDYDTYDSAVVCAKDEETARNMEPSPYLNGEKKDFSLYDASWCSSPDKVKVVYLGEAAPDIKHGVLCSSFNAG